MEFKLDYEGTFIDHDDGTRKSVFFAEGGQPIEMTLLFNRIGTDVVCCPEMGFCNLGCTFCHLTRDGDTRPMTKVRYGDFAEALFRTVHAEQGFGPRLTGNPKLLLSFMGVGEPLLNLELIDDVLAHAEETARANGYVDVGFSIASMFPNANVDELWKISSRHVQPVKVHFSLHSPIDAKRRSMIPAAKIGVAEAMGLLHGYRSRVMSDPSLAGRFAVFHPRNPDPTEIHYTLIEGVNDSDEELEELVRLLGIHRIPVKFIRFNPVNGMARSPREGEWMEAIKESVPGLQVKSYDPPGHQVGSSCGEFTRHYYHSEAESDEERAEFERWRQEHLVEGESVSALSPCDMP